MLKRLGYLLGFLFVLTGTGIFAQNQAAKWYFGAQAGLDFMTSPPTPLSGSMTTSEGCSSISDANGNLLFYTDGISVWNSTHAVMANGTGMLGNGSTSQSGVIVKQPGNTNIYFIFSLDQLGSGNGLRYSTVDMALAAGLGSVTAKNVLLQTTTCEKITSARHCNGTDFWIITHDYQSANFRANLISATGVNTVGVLSSVGPSYNTIQSTVGCMKTSPNGKKLMVANGYTTFELYDFDASTGAVSNFLLLGSYSSYGCEFSPDNTKCYGGNWGSGAIYQWDLCAGSNSAIVSSSLAIGTTTSTKGQFQLGTDGKIYIARTGKNYLSTINSPNTAGTGCGFVDVGQTIAPKMSNSGLPNFITNYFTPAQTPFTHTVSNNFGCQTASFTAPPTVTNFTTIGCASSGYSLMGVQWIFGDPASGSANTSTVINPYHSYTSLGTFTAHLIINYSCGGGTDTISQVVNVNQPCISVTSTSITCANLGTATVQATGGVGPYSYTWMPTSQTTSVATGLSPGSYSITVFDYGNSFTYTAHVVFNSLIPLTGNIAASSSVSCFGASTGTGAVTNLAGGSGSQNYNWFNGTITHTSSSPTSLSAGVWSITVTDALTGCQIKQSFFISQPPALVLTLSSSTANACIGQSVVLTGTNSGGTPGYTYTWTNGPQADTYTVTQTTAGTFAYFLNSTDSNGCVTSNSITADFIANPTVTVSDVSVCPLAVGTLTAYGASTYIWNGSSPGNMYSQSPLADTQYTVVGTALGCTAAATASIILHPLPSPVFNSNSPVCNAQSLLLTGGGGSGYKWTGPSGFNSTISSPTINPANTSHSGVYHLTVTSVNGCTASTTSSLTVYPSPTLAATGATACTSETLNLSSSSEPGATYSWMGPMSFNSALQNPSISSLTVNRSGTYWVVATSVLGCTSTTSVSVLVVPPPGLTASLNTSTLCSHPFNGSPNTVTLTAGGALSYTFLSGPDLSVSNPGGPVSSLTAVPPFVGAGTATVLGSNGVCAVSTTVGFSVISNPVISVPPAPVICAGDSYTFTTQGAAFYTWSASGQAISVNSNGSAAVVHPNVTATYSVFGGSAGCNSDTRTSTLIVNPLPVFTISPASPTICLNKSVVLSAQGTATAYAWAPFMGLSQTSGSDVSASPQVQQTYTVTGYLNGCVNTAVTTVSVLALPVPTLSVSKTTLCLNDTMTLKGSGGEIYEWRIPPSIYYNKKELIIQVGGSIAAGGIFSLTVTDGSGCQNTATQLITVNKLPQGSLSGVKEAGCVPLCTDYIFSAGNNISSTWMIGDQVFGNEFSYCFNEPGTFTINGILVDNLTGCRNTTDLFVTVFPRPDADFRYQPLKPVEGLDEVRFINSTVGNNQAKWRWFFIENNGYQSHSENTTFIFDAPGEYPVAFVVTDINQCSDTAIKKIKVEPDFTIYIPDAFTPNGDQVNDVFLPVVRSSYLYTLSVFDRWGQRIFYSTSHLSGWDGTFLGTGCKMDVYTYRITLSTIAGEKKEYTGHVSLVR